MKMESVILFLLEQDIRNPFLPNVFRCFQGDQKGILGRKGLNSSLLKYSNMSVS